MSESPAPRFATSRSARALLAVLLAACKPLLGGDSMVSTFCEAPPVPAPSRPVAEFPACNQTPAHEGTFNPERTREAHAKNEPLRCCYDQHTPYKGGRPLVIDAALCTASLTARAWG